MNFRNKLVIYLFFFLLPLKIKKIKNKKNCLKSIIIGIIVGIDRIYHLMNNEISHNFENRSPVGNCCE